MTPGTDTSSWCFRYLVSVENVADPAECFPLCLAVLVGVDLQGDGQPGMAQDQLGVAGRDLQVLQQGGGGVPQMVHGDDPQPVCVADPAEGPGEVARLDWSSCFGTEDEAGVLPGAPQLQPVGGLDSAAELQDLGDRGEQRQVAAPGGTLDRAGAQLAVDALDVLADPQLAVLLVLWVPKTSSTSCDQAIFVDQATDASLSSDAVPVEIDRFG